VLTEFERRLIQATQAGLPLVPRPYAQLALQLGCSTAEVQQTLADMLARGLIRRIGAVPHHMRLGWKANGMTVWDVDDAQLPELGARIGALPFVSHCYERPRAPGWPYNLFAMLHGRERAEVQAQRAELRALLGPACRGDDILYSSATLKKTGLRLKDD